MKKYTLFILLFLSFLSIQAQENESLPYFYIYGLNDNQFPLNNIRTFVFDKQKADDPHLDKSHFSLFLNNIAHPISYISKDTAATTFNINWIVDRNIKKKDKEIISQLYDQFIDMEFQNISFDLLETDDFSVDKKFNLFFWRNKHIASNNLDSIASFPVLDSISKEKGKKLFIIFIQSCKDIEKPLSVFLDNENSANKKHLYAFYIMDQRNICFNHAKKHDNNIIMPQSILYSKAFNKNSLSDCFSQTLKAYSNAFYNIGFYLNQHHNLDTSFTISLSMGSGDLIQTDTISHVFKTEHIEKAFIDYVIEKSDTLSKNKEYEKAQHLLLEAFAIYPDVLFKNIAEELIKNQSTDLLNDSATDPHNLFMIAEEQWGFSVNNNDWYKTLKTDLLKHYFENNSDLEINKRLNLLTQIYELDSLDTKFKVLYHHASGEKYFEENEVEKAIQTYFKVFDMEESPRFLKSSLLTALEEYFPQKHSSMQYEDIYCTGIKTYELFSDQFQMVFYFAVAARQMHDFQRASQLYNYLMSNWVSAQNLITWAQLLSDIELLSLQIFDFNRALDFNKRIQRNYGGTGQIEKYLLNLRVKQYYPLSRMMAIFFKRNGARHNLRDIDRHYPGDIPYGINGIYMLDQNSNITYIAYGGNDIKPPDISKIGDNSEMLLRTGIDAGLKAYIIHALENSIFLVLELNNKKSSSAVIAMRDISNRSMLDDPWNSLKQLEYNSNVRRTAIVFSYMANIEINRRGSLSTASYRSAAGQYFEYMVLHNSKGEIQNSANFDLTKAVYPHGGWERSSITPAYLEQKISYSNRILSEIILPMYNNAVFAGTIRIALK